MAVIQGSSTNWFLLSVADSGAVVESTEAEMERVLDVDSITKSDTVQTSAPLRPAGLTPVEEPFATVQGYRSFAITVGADPNDLTQTELGAANGASRKVGIRLKRFFRGEVVNEKTLICSVVGVDESRSRDGEQTTIFRIAADPPAIPYVEGSLGPFRIANSATVTLVLNRLWVGASSFALGTIDPSTAASAAAVYTSASTTLVITADAARTGTTKIPITATAANGQTTTETVAVIVD